MSELRSAIEALDVLVLGELPDALIEDGFAEVRRAREQLEVIELRFLAEADRRQIHARDGHLSAASWLASRHNASWGSARAQVATARALEHMPGTLEALRSGEVSLSAARLLAAARQTNPEAFEAAEPYLVEAARIQSISDLSIAIAYWRQRVERDEAMSTEEALRERRRLHASVTFGGMVRVDGDLDPETGELLLAALASVMDAGSKGSSEQDTRTSPQRRCDAMAEIMRQYLDRGDRAEVAGERPHMAVTIDASVLAGTKEGLCEMDHVGPIDPNTALRLACDASVMRVVMSGDSQPLDVGRRTSVVPASMRRAMIMRDRHCRFPGCDRPQTWCDAHHVVHWARGGSTSVDNLVLLCRRHHRLIHGPDGFRLEIEDGRPVFRRPDGERVDAPP